MPELSAILSIFDPTTLLHRGHVAVATSPTRAPKPHQIYYELHGPDVQAPRLVLIMGLNNSCFAWTHQVNWLVGDDSAASSLLNYFDGLIVARQRFTGN